LKISRSPSGRKRPYSLSLSGTNTEGALTKATPPLRSARPDFARGQPRIGEIFEHLRTNYEIELLIAKRQGLSCGSHINQMSDSRINRDLATHGLSKQYAVRLQPAANVENRKIAFGQPQESHLQKILRRSRSTNQFGFLKDGCKRRRPSRRTSSNVGRPGMKC
jgi:hypothetical protein